MHDPAPPSHLDVRAFARSAGALQGQSALSAFARVAGECQGDAAAVGVAWSAQGELRGEARGQAQVWLHLQARTELPLVCQRCLDVVVTPLVVDRSFRFVADEETAAAQDDDAVEDLLVLSPDFDLRELVEDELVLALPLIAAHAVCPTPVAFSAQDAQFDEPSAAEPGAFAVLAKLRRGPGGESG